MKLVGVAGTSHNRGLAHPIPNILIFDSRMPTWRSDAASLMRLNIVPCQSKSATHLDTVET